VILAIDGFFASVGVASDLLVRRLTVANLVTIGAPFASQFLKSFDANEPAAATGPRVTSTIFTNSFAGAVGDQIMVVRASGTTLPVFFTNPYILRGNDPAGLNALAVIGESVNVQIRVSFLCREFPFPG